jgi:cell division septum initiation protein DivIVA
MSLPAIIEELDELVQRSRHMPGNRLLVDDAALKLIADQLRDLVVAETARAKRGPAERDSAVNEARNLARRVLDDAQAQREAMLDEQTVVKAARERATQIQRDAESYANTIRAEADRYVALQLNSLEIRLQRVLREVRAGQHTLSSEGGATDHPTG